jgi:uncharacterized protein (TIGR00369 family)
VLLAEPGLAFLQGMIAGRHPAPPFAKETGILLVEAEANRAVFRGTPTERFFNPSGTIHGGWISMILDSAMGCAIHSTLQAGQGYTTIEMKLNFVRAVLPELGELTCEAHLVHRGGTIATSEGKLFDGKGRLLAHGTETGMILDMATRGAKAA